MIIGFYLLTVFVSSTHAEIPLNKPNDKHSWLTLGLGTSPEIFGLYGGLPVDIGIIFSFYRQNNIFSYRFINLYEFDMEYNSENIMDFSILYGRKKFFTDQAALVSAGFGPGFITGHRHGKPLGCCLFEDILFNALGLSLEAQAFLTARRFGLGTYLFANFNTEWNVYGFLLCLQFGKIR